MVSYNLSKAVGMNKDWNDIWAEILNSKCKSKFSVSNIISQSEKEWDDWVKKHPEDKNEKKRTLLWDIAIVNYIGERGFKSDFLWIFADSMFPYISKTKNQKLVIDGILIERFIDDIRKNKGILSFVADNEEERLEFLTYIEFLIRGMEKAVFTP